MKIIPLILYRKVPKFTSKQCFAIKIKDIQFYKSYPIKLPINFQRPIISFTKSISYFSYYFYKNLSQNWDKFSQLGFPDKVQLDFRMYYKS